MHKDCFVQNKGDYNKTLKWKNISFKKCRFGISIKSCKEFSIEDCLFINNGWDSTEPVTETIGGYKKLLENDPANVSIIDSNGKKIIDGGSIYIENCDKVKITGIEISKSSRGIYLSNCENAFITNNYIHDNLSYSISLDNNCNNLTISNNNIVKSRSNGIYISNT